MSPGRIAVWQAGPEDLGAHFAIRHQVFVEEQGVMVLTDADRWDSDARVVHVVAAVGNNIIGAVRLYPLDGDRRWKGDRLAVLRAHRASWVGAHLVHFAVATAASAGGGEMEASVQLPNVRFFQRLGWRCDGDDYLYHGLLHQPMLFDLAQAPSVDFGVRPSRPRLAVEAPAVTCPLLSPV